MEERIIVAGFRPPKDRKMLIDRKEVTDKNGKMDYKKLVEKVDKLGERLMRENKIIDMLGDAIDIRRRYRCTRLQ